MADTQARSALSSLHCHVFYLKYLNLGTSLWARWRLKSPAPRLFAQALVQAHIKTPKLHVTDLCEEKPLVTGGFPSQRASNVENFSIWWFHHDKNLPSVWLAIRITKELWLSLSELAKNHHLSQFWPRSVSLYGITRPQWVDQTYYCKVV